MIRTLMISLDSFRDTQLLKVPRPIQSKGFLFTQLRNAKIKYMNR